jgi:L-alanine-DL-glutamate epimerase-like enolase superfamily enzyme
VKLRVGREPDRDVERAAAVRAAVGPDVRILVDANERLGLATALWLGRRLAAFDPFWFEEPILSGDLQGYRRLREALPMPIAFGEHVFARREFVAAIAADAVDVLQPNMCMVGGVTEAMRIGRLAAAHGLSMAPDFMTPLHIHIVAALPSATYVEYYPFMDDLLASPLVVEGGEVLVPDRPGHGVAFTDKAWARYRVAGA